MRRYLLFLAACVFFSFYFSCSTAEAQTASGGAAECEKLKKEHETLIRDYDNALAQIKALVPYKNKLKDMEDSYRQYDLVREQAAKEKESLLRQAAELRDKIRQMDETIVKLTQERDDYKKSFEKASVENIISDETKKKMTDIEQEKSSLAKEAGELQTRIRLMEGAALKKEAEIELHRRQLDEIKTKYAEAKRINQELEKKIENVPRKFAELARENKILIKRTGMMHYNLGVFYTQNREFERAIAEFEKAVELNPEDGASHFNLGYIYAEHFQNRPKAVASFKQFLKLAKRDDKDVDWVKRYILTWQAWEGNVPIK